MQYFLNNLNKFYSIFETFCSFFMIFIWKESKLIRKTIKFLLYSLRKWRRNQNLAYFVISQMGRKLIKHFCIRYVGIFWRMAELLLRMGRMAEPLLRMRIMSGGLLKEVDGRNLYRRSGKRQNLYWRREE